MTGECAISVTGTSKRYGATGNHCYYYQQANNDDRAQYYYPGASVTP